MVINLPVKNLVRFTMLVAVVTGVIVFLYLIQDKTVFIQGKNKNYPLVYTVMTILAIALIGFGNIYILIFLRRRFGMNSKKFHRYRYIFTYAGSAAAYLLIWPLFASLSQRSWSYFDLGLLSTFLISGALVNTVMIILQNFIMLQNDKARADLELSSLKIAHAEAANLLLKQQIHPHFLFNALSILKSLYRRDTDAGDAYIVHLANFLRASIFVHDSKVSRLDEELALLKDYLEMQKMRFGTALVCTIDIPGQSLKSYYLPTFSLQPLLENTIKHNELTEEMPLRVDIYQNHDRIVVCNNLQRRTVREYSTKNGLANLAERYRLLSGDEIAIKEYDNLFSVSIKLLTDEYRDHRR